MTLRIAQNAGPFLVTSQNGGSDAGGSSQTVTWAVNGTQPLAHNVAISLSTDGGQTWSSLGSSTPNDGSAQVTLPTGSTTKARIRVSAVDTYFFAVNGADFTIS